MSDKYAKYWLEEFHDHWQALERDVENIAELDVLAELISVCLKWTNRKSSSGASSTSRSRADSIKSLPASIRLLELPEDEDIAIELIQNRTQYYVSVNGNEFKVLGFCVQDEETFE